MAPVAEGVHRVGGALGKGTEAVVLCPHLSRTNGEEIGKFSMAPVAEGRDSRNERGREVQETWWGTQLASRRDRGSRSKHGNEAQVAKAEPS